MAMVGWGFKWLKKQPNWLNWGNLNRKGNSGNQPLTMALYSP